MMTTSKEPVLVVFDIDGTLGRLGPLTDSEMWSDRYLLAMPSYPNMVDLVKGYLRKRNVSVMFCTGRPTKWHGATWRWLNSKLGLSGSGQKATLVCRPEEVPTEKIPAFKLDAILQAIRRLGSRPSEAVLFDDDVNNLRLYETLRPMVRKLTLFKVDEGMISDWSL